MGITALILALALALSINTVPVKRTVDELLQALGSANAVKDTDDGYAAYQRGDYATALRHLRPLADKGDARAQSALGLMYYHGRGVPQHDPEAANWFRLAADQDDTVAQFHLGAMHAQGRGVPQDFNEAVKWYHLAADRGHGEAQYNLGLSYVKGEGVSKDYVTAHMWFNLAAAHFAPSELRKRELAVRNRDLVANRMTREQLAEAQNLARAWKLR
jgi:uncharacterized protein